MADRHVILEKRNDPSWLSYKEERNEKGDFVVTAYGLDVVTHAQPTSEGFTLSCVMSE